MTILLAVLGVVFAAFALWLGVRIVNRRERWAMRTALVLIVLLVGYPLSFGPACWITSRIESGGNLGNCVSRVYGPLVSLFWHRGTFKETRSGVALKWYSTVGSAPDWKWVHVPALDESGNLSQVLIWMWIPI